jgi:hypothetical protein
MREPLPSQMLGIHYYFAFLPWLLQDEGVVFGEAGEATLPDESKLVMPPGATVDR